MRQSNVVPWPVAARPTPTDHLDPKKVAGAAYRRKLLAEAESRAASSSDPIFGAIVAHLTAVVAYLDAR